MGRRNGAPCWRVGEGRTLLYGEEGAKLPLAALNPVPGGYRFASDIMGVDIVLHNSLVEMVRYVEACYTAAVHELPDGTAEKTEYIGNNLSAGTGKMKKIYYAFEESIEVDERLSTVDINALVRIMAAGKEYAWSDCKGVFI